MSTKQSLPKAEICQSPGIHFFRLPLGDGRNVRYNIYDEEVKPIAERIVAMWNACEGIDTETLKNAQPGEILGWGRVEGMVPRLMAEKTELQYKLNKAKAELLEMETFVERGESLVNSMERRGPWAYRIGFEVGMWWADRPWRKDRQQIPVGPTT